MQEPVIAVRNLRRTFGSTVAVEDLSFDVAPGEVVGLLGANGAGKTTAMGILLGLMEATSGSARIFGLDPLRDRIRILTRCNFSSAYTGLPGNLTVRQNLLVFAGIYRVRKPGPKIDELLELLEIAPLRDRAVTHLSAGESTRLHLCKALLNDPELLLLDEPTASLDPDIADKVRRILRQVRRDRGMAILYTSHNMRDVEDICDRVLFMHRGRVVAEGSPAAVVERFRQRSMEDVFISIVRGGDLQESGGN